LSGRGCGWVREWGSYGCKGGHHGWRRGGGKKVEARVLSMTDREGPMQAYRRSRRQGGLTAHAIINTQPHRPFDTAASTRARSRARAGRSSRWRAPHRSWRICLRCSWRCSCCWLWCSRSGGRRSPATPQGLGGKDRRGWGGGRVLVPCQEAQAMTPASPAAPLTAPARRARPCQTAATHKPCHRPCPCPAVPPSQSPQSTRAAHRSRLQRRGW
jgi:hypothetical protein